MRITAGLSLLLILAPMVFAQAPVPVAKPSRPLPAVERVVIIAVDGLRPDLLILSDSPALHSLIKSGSYSMWAHTTPVAITLPSFTSMLTGVAIKKHKIEWNRDLPLLAPVYPAVPTVFELAGAVGYHTAMIAGKAKFDTLNKPGTITRAFIPARDHCTDAEAAAEAIKAIEHDKPDLLFVHFPGVDTVGHDKGWGSPEQFATIAGVDRQVSGVLAALDRAGLREHAVIIVTADHGGSGRTHGSDDARSLHIPWIITGPGVRRGFDLTRIENLQVHTEDTCATACWLLGVARPAYFDGKAITEAFAGAD